MAVLDKTTEMLFKAVVGQTSLGEDPVMIQTPAMALTAVKKLASELGGSKMSVGAGTFRMPMTSRSDNSADPVDMKVYYGICRKL